MKQAVIFGGSGFIGQYLTQTLLQEKLVDKVIIADVKPVNSVFPEIFDEYFKQGQVEFVKVDVRESIQLKIDAPLLVANLAAVHREPGHEDHEYFECNLLGAENVCQWTEEVGGKFIVFTSSIAPYGPSESARDENSIPVPKTAYGSSKLAAEKIHIGWQRAQSSERKLVIVRPGVVFGPGEGGNVSRLIKAVIRGYFLYMGNHKTRKAGIYVKELCRAILWLCNKVQAAEMPPIVLANLSMNPGPSMEEYVEVIKKISGVKRPVPSVPFFVLYPLSFIFEAVARVLRISQPISPVRLRKLVRSNNILPTFLEKNAYHFHYSLEDAMREWKRELPSDW